MIELINKIANSIMFIFCLWAVLEKQCKKQLIGTFALSLVAMSAMMNIIRPESVGLVESHFEVIFITWHASKLQMRLKCRDRKGSGAKKQSPFSSQHIYLASITQLRLFFNNA